jgi:CRISP-associated protein Cas1
MTAHPNTEPLIRVMALHALAYCERLFFLEEVEEIRVADAAVYEGRAMHVEIEDAEPMEPLELADEEIGLVGKVDALRRRDGTLIAYEHKKGRSAGGEAWESDLLQVAAYALLLERAFPSTVVEGRIRYHADNKLVRVPQTDALRGRVLDAVKHARELRKGIDRPAVTMNERLCIRCSLAPVCLPEEERLVDDPKHEVIRLFPPHRDRLTVHVLNHGTRVGRTGNSFTIRDLEGTKTVYPAAEVGDIVVHGYSQVTTQAITLCAYQEIGVHFVTGAGRYVAGLTPGAGRVQRKLRQYRALTDPVVCLQLAHQLVRARASGQIAFLLRATRGRQERSDDFNLCIQRMRNGLRGIARAESLDALRGHEGQVAKAYFEALPVTYSDDVPPELRHTIRTRRPPKDRFSAMLNYGYGLLYRQVMQAVIAVGLEPACGFYHTPRSAAHPLVLDLMELFRVPLCDVPIIASLNRQRWDPRRDFDVAPARIWLSHDGRRKAVQIFESRLEQTWRHPVVGYSLSYARLIELEARLLEKEWCGKPGVFARYRPR